MSSPIETTIIPRTVAVDGETLITTNGITAVNPDGITLDNSGTALEIKAGAIGFNEIATQTNASQTVFNFTGLSTSNYRLLKFKGILTLGSGSGGGNSGQLIFNGDTTSANYTGYWTNVQITGSTLNGGQVGVCVGGSNLPITPITVPFAFDVEITRDTTNGVTFVDFHGSGYAASNEPIIIEAHFIWKSAAAITSIAMSGGSGVGYTTGSFATLFAMKGT